MTDLESVKGNNKENKMSNKTKPKSLSNKIFDSHVQVETQLAPEECEPCPKCGKQEVFGIVKPTGEDWFVCEGCGWGHKIRIRRFGYEVLDRLRKLLKRSRSDWLESEAKDTLKTVLEECQANGYGQGCPVPEIEDLLNQSMLTWEESDWQFIQQLSCLGGLPALNEEAKWVYETESFGPENPAKYYVVPLSALRPMEELQDYLEAAGELENGPKSLKKTQ